MLALVGEQKIMANKPNVPSRALVYAMLYPKLKDIALKHGYALAIHGSMSRDMDLIAFPWVENCSSPEAMVEDMNKALEGTLSSPYQANPAMRPHGRMSWSIYHKDNVDASQPYVDISVFVIKK